MSTIENKASKLIHTIWGLDETFHIEHMGEQFEIRVERDEVKPGAPARTLIQSSGAIRISMIDSWWACFHQDERMLFRVRYGRYRRGGDRLEVVFIAPQSWRIHWEHHSRSCPPCEV